MIESTLVYLIQNDYWLMLLRNKKTNDINQNKWIGVGGKKERNETIEECAIRETFEETGLKIQSLQYHGLVRFDYEKAESEKIYVYTSNDFTGVIHECNEGTLSWIKREDILNLNLWQGDKLFLNHLFHHFNDLFCLYLVYDKDDSLIHYDWEK